MTEPVRAEASELLRDPVIEPIGPPPVRPGAVVARRGRPAGAERWGALARRLVRPVLVIAVLTFANATAWALITPAFQAPDEEQHAAYAAYLAETGNLPSSNAHRAFASTDERLALQATRHYTMFMTAAITRPPWLARDQRDYDRLIARLNPRRDDGGGQTGASGYGPVYYAAAAAGYDLVGGSFFSRLFGMRLISALLAALTVRFVYGTIRELLPRHRWAAVAGALAVAFQPMFGFISGAVNNDAAANLAGAALLYLVVRAMRRGLSTRSAVAIGVTLVVGAVAKTTVIALVPAIAVGLLIAWRRGRVTPRAWLALGGSLGAAALAWVLIARGLDRSVLPNTGLQSTAAGTGGGGSSGPVTLLDRLEYAWQVFLPPLPGMRHLYTGSDVVPAWTIYVKRLWGSFGWLTIDLPGRVYDLIALVGLGGLALGVRTFVRERVAVRSRAGEIVVLLVALLGVMAVMHYAFARNTPASYVIEQGRYLFPAITVLAVAAIGACFGLGRRWAPVLGVALVSGMVVLSAVSQLYVFTKYFT